MSNFTKNIIWAVVTLIVISLLFSLFAPAAKAPTNVDLNTLASDINSGSVQKVSVNGDELDITMKDGSSAISQKEDQASFADTMKDFGVDPTALQSVDVAIQNQSGWAYWGGLLIDPLLSLLFIGLIFWFMFRQAKTGVNQAFSFGRSNLKISSFKDRVLFKDVAGLKEAKEELIEVVDFLKNPKKFLDLGATIPRGVLLVGAPGTGKCVTGDTLVTTQKGLVPIADVPKYFAVNDDYSVEGAKVWSFDEATSQFSWREPSHWFNLGRQATIKIKTQVGVDIEGTPEHPIIVLQEDGALVFKRLDQMRKGDLVPVAYGMNAFGSYPKISDEAFAYFLGLIIGDGGLTTKGRICFTNADTELVDFVRDFVKDRWNYELQWASRYDYYIANSAIKAELVDCGLAQVESEHKRIPESVMLASKQIVVAFLRGLFDTDGYCGKQEVELSSASRELARTVHQLLLNLGIVSRLHDRKKLYNGKQQHYLTISGDFLEPFQREIGFGLRRKQEKLVSLLQKTRNTNNNLVYHQGSRLKKIWTIMRLTGFSAEKEFYSASFYKNFHRYIAGTRTPPVATLEKALTFCKTECPALLGNGDLAYLENIVSSHLFFTKITDIAESEADVFDFTVPVTHSFVANGLINHNTLMARAVAGESGVPFFYMSASEFVEMFVGVGSARVRDSFQTAKRAAPAILFIDEIDAIGRQRGAGFGGSNDEREQTLNQILVEMDGFDRDTKLIVLAATNRPDILDSALLRPGRFDRRVVLDLPDINDREAILKIHAEGKTLEAGADLRKVAIRTPGFSGADLANLMNEAAIITARRNKKMIGQSELFEAAEKVILGPERRSRVISPREKEITAYHEGGHALVAAAMKDADPVQKISIVSRGFAGGYTMKLPMEEQHLKTRNQFLADLAMMMGGYAAEELTFGDVSTGASSDLKEASELARRLVTKYGMSDLGPMTFGKSEEMTFMGREMSERNYSEKVASEIDEQVHAFLMHAYETAQKVLRTNKMILKKIADTLVAKETLEHDDFYALLKQYKLRPVVA